MTVFSSSPEIESHASLGIATAALEAAYDTLEARLIRRAQAGDTAAFRTLVESHQDMIYRLSGQWLHCGEDAREACQDTFLKAWQALPAWQPRGKLGTWLYQIALNQCRDRAKSRTTRQRRATVTFDHLPAAAACPGPSPDLAAPAVATWKNCHAASLFYRNPRAQCSSSAAWNPSVTPKRPPSCTARNGRAKVGTGARRPPLPRPAAADGLVGAASLTGGGIGFPG